MTLISVLASFGAALSLFMGLFAVRILVFQGLKPKFEDKAPSWHWWLYQFLFNLICSLIGWTLAILYVWRWNAEQLKFSFSGADVVPLLLALLGITGLLPRALWAFSALTGELSKKLTG
jgi:hypothetical protein